MPFTQNSLTKKFINDVKILIGSGKVASLKVLAKNLGANYSGLNQVVNGRRNVPADVYNKFTEMYNPKEVKVDVAGIEIALQNQAMSRVMLRAMAELLSVQRKEAVTKTLSDLEAAVRSEIQLVGDKL